MTPTLLLLVLTLLPFSAFAGEMDLSLRKIIQVSDQTKPTFSESVFKKKNVIVQNGVSLIPCIIKTSNSATTIDAIKFAGGQANSVAGDIITARLPVEKAEEIISRSEVVYAEAASKLSKKMDTARNATFVDVVQNGSALGTAYNGTNVVVGVVDDTLDYGHPDFLGTDGLTRIQYIKQTGTDLSTTECTKQNIDCGSCAITNGGQGYNHGTHVTGTAAGANTTYTGVAPLADIVFVFDSSTTPDTSGSTSTSFASAVLDGVTTVFNKANTLDKAAVTNLSLGTSIGAHDGTSLLEQGLTNLTNAKPGRIIVNAAGNENVMAADFSSTSGLRDIIANIGGIHAQITAAASQNIGFRAGVWSGADVSSSAYGGSLVDVWLTNGQKDNCSIQVFAYTNGRYPINLNFTGLSTTDNAVLSTTAVPFATNTTTDVTATGSSVEATISVEASNSLNSKPHAHVILSPVSGASTTYLERVWFDVVIRANGSGPCDGHMWFYPDYVAMNDFLKGMTGKDVGDGSTYTGYTMMNGDSFYTTTIPATANNVIAVGSWMSVKPLNTSVSQWIGDNGTTYSQSDISAPGGTGSITDDWSLFSSLGPTADGRTKPEIAAPGEPIISTLASDASMPTSVVVGGTHFKDAGTSMASPHVTGIVALLLERNNTLTATQVVEAIKQQAFTTGFSATPTADTKNTYGDGKVNAAGVLASVAVPATPYYSGTGNFGGTCPSTSACTLVKNAKPQWTGLLLVIAMLSLLIFSRKFIRMK